MKSKQIILVSIATSLSMLSGSVLAMEGASDSMMMKSDSMMKSDTMMKTDSMMAMHADLKMGSRGTEVVKLQTALETAGYLKIAKGIKKGYFGPSTRAALKAFQKANKMAQSGIYDSKTMTKLDAVVTMKTGVMVGGALMVRNLDIVDNAVKANNVTTVVAAVKAGGLVDTLKSAGPFTVFAPNNAAFEKLPAGTVDTLLKPENKATLVDILTYHVVAGKYTTADLHDGMTLTTVEGKTLEFTMVNGKLAINGTAMIETADVISKNGVTHVIDTVLMPQ